MTVRTPLACTMPGEACVPTTPLACSMRTDTESEVGKRVTATVLVFLFCLLYTVTIVAQERTQRSSKDGLAKTEISRLGFGKRVHLKLKNGERRAGRITGFAQDHFVVTDSKGAASAIAYSDVSRVTQQREKLGVFDAPWKGIMFTVAAVGAVLVFAMEVFN